MSDRIKSFKELEALREKDLKAVKKAEEYKFESNKTVTERIIKDGRLVTMGHLSFLTSKIEELDTIQQEFIASVESEINSLKALVTEQRDTITNLETRVGILEEALGRK